jgi:hypothetical protein
LTTSSYATKTRAVARGRLHPSWPLPLALAIASCGGRVDSSASQSLQAAAGGGGSDPAGTGAGVYECTLQRSTNDPVENCNRYCAGLWCTACPSEVSACEQSCKEAYSKGDLKEACLACAVDHGGAILSSFSCNSLASLDSGHLTFSIVFRVADCGSVCSF